MGTCTIGDSEIFENKNPPTIMTGRGKGGKGLGKGGAKRHRKVLRDNIQVKYFDVENLC